MNRKMEKLKKAKKEKNLKVEEQDSNKVVFSLSWVVKDFL